MREERPRTINRQPLGPDDAQAALDLAEATVRAFDEVRAET